jgi:hypothetical protein
MGSGTLNEGQISRLIADEYASRILRATYQHPMSVQQLSRKCNIPIAVAYRRIGDMESSGLVRCVRQEEVYRGKKVKFYSCAVRLVKYSFDEGDFSIEVDWLPDEELQSQEEFAES